MQCAVARSKRPSVCLLLRKNVAFFMDMNHAHELMHAHDVQLASDSPSRHSHAL
jgi:hypothetical protein